ncbi:translation initiation factor IF-3, partial [Acidobacteria bacterium AH-259-L09]|nr:translation initiation factor IF-3 [Acidobacteria bacterium AH-259-L09]
MNHQIRSREIRVIDEDGNQLGIMDPRQGISAALKSGLD